MVGSLRESGWENRISLASRIIRRVGEGIRVHYQPEGESMIPWQGGFGESRVGTMKKALKGYRRSQSIWEQIEVGGETEGSNSEHRKSPAL